MDVELIVGECSGKVRLMYSSKTDPRIDLCAVSLCPSNTWTLHNALPDCLFATEPSATGTENIALAVYHGALIGLRTRLRIRKQRVQGSGVCQAVAAPCGFASEMRFPFT